MLSIETVQDALALMKNHTDNRALDQLLAPDLVREFELFAETKLAQLDVVRAPRELSRRLFHLADDRASILLLPLDNNEVHLYAELETEAPGGANQGEDAEAVLFVVDVSASMNHDERGSYLAPNSLDHRASSIAKARALVEPLVLASLRRGASVAVVPWNFEAMPAIRFRPPPAAAAAADDEQAPDALDDVALRAEIRVRCGSDAFRAHGATNIEAALERSLDLAREATLRPNAGWTHVTLFLLTDGDETIYLDQNRKPQRVPTDPNHAQFAHFNHVGEGGTTAYQRQLCAMMARGKQDLLAHRCQLDVHVCGVGEAPTQFLRALREAVNGHFHALADVARLADEMRAAGLVRGGDGEPVVIGDEQCVRIGALYDAEVGALCARTTVSPAVAWRLVSARDDVGTAVLFRGSRSTVRCVARDETSDAIRETATRVLTFERRLGAAIDRLRHEQITRNAVRDAMDMIGAVRRERDEAVATLARAVRRRSLLQRFLQAVLAGAETQLAALERLLARYHAPAAAQFDASAAERAELFTARDQLAIAAGLESVRVRIGALAPSRVERRVERLVAQRGQWARAMLGRRCHVERVDDAAAGTTTLRLRVGAGAQAPDVAPLVELQCSTEALDECATRLLDPLSFASFLDTIADADTLPSALYVIAADQPPGVLFEQQETLWIKSGGLEVTTLDYFRLFAKLHGRDVDGTPRPVRVPGTFADANFALPLAPDRLTIEVLVQTAAGKLSEPVTGTAMAPLTGVGLFYVAFVAHHLARDTVTGAEARRVAELIATLHQWLRHPNTFPKWPDVEALVERLVVRRGIEQAHSCGRQGVPTRAYLFAMLVDNTFARAERFAALVAESRRRSCALVERADALRLAVELAGGEVERDDADEPPLQLLAVLAELRDGHVRDARIGAAWARQIAAGETRVNMWRLLYRWCVATANNAVPTMLEQFARFEPADQFERQLHAGCAAALPFDRVLHMWLQEDDKSAVFVLLDDGVLRVDATTGVVDAPLPLDERRLRDDVLGVLLGLVNFKGSATAGYGLLKRDWAVVRALRAKGEPAVVAEVAPIAELRDAATTPQTALAMLVPPELAGAIQAVRAQHDPAFARWPPHATLLFPFLEAPVALSDAVLQRVDAELRRLPPFRVTLSDFDTFERSGTLFLTVQTEPRDALLAVYRTLAALFPACLKAGGGQAFNAHVTVARGDDTFALERIAADLRRRRWQPVVFECRHVALLTRDADTPFVVARELPLAGAAASVLDLERALTEAQHAEYKRALAGRVDVYRRWHRAPAPVTPLPAGVNAAHCVAATDSAATLSVVLIGDVDSGKSSMSGRLVAELGGLPPHVFKEYERVCRMLERPRALYAFVMDRLREERERQLSIEVHMWAVQALGTTIDLIDCPGHRRFLKNMATGASVADGALLMVSAAREEFERGIAAGVGMTRTEALVAHACGGVREFVVAVNKLDLFDDVESRRARFDEVCESVARILAACGIVARAVHSCGHVLWRQHFRGARRAHALVHRSVGDPSVDAAEGADATRRRRAAAHAGAARAPRAGHWHCAVGPHRAGQRATARHGGAASERRHGNGGVDRALPRRQDAGRGG